MGGSCMSALNGGLVVHLLDVFFGIVDEFVDEGAFRCGGVFL